MRLPIVDEGAPRGGELTELPPLHETFLDWDGVDCLLADLDDLTELIEILGRTPTGHTVLQHDIVAARDALRSGDLAALQVTYEFADQRWSDTLLTTAEGARLLRMVDPKRVA